MSATVQLLDRWKALKGIASDNQAALTLGITRATVSLWRTNDSEGEAHIVARLANDLGEDATGYVLMVEAHKQRSAESRRALIALAKKFLPYAATLFLTLIAQNGNCKQLQLSTMQTLHKDSIVYKGVVTV